MLDSQQAVRTEDFRFPSGEAMLSARLYLPMYEPETVVVLNSATGVPRDYYRHFANWLASDQGMACLTFDYRDFGLSVTGRLRDSKVTMADWALVDRPYDVRVLGPCHSYRPPLALSGPCRLVLVWSRAPCREGAGLSARKGRWVRLRPSGFGVLAMAQVVHLARKLPARDRCRSA